MFLTVTGVRWTPRPIGDQGWATHNMPGLELVGCLCAADGNAAGSVLTLG